VKALRERTTTTPCQHDCPRAVGGAPTDSTHTAPTTTFQATSREYFILRMPEIMVGVKKTAIRPSRGERLVLATAFCRWDHQRP